MKMFTKLRYNITRNDNFV